MKEYNHLKIEKKWQKEWAKKKIYKTLSLLEARSKKLEAFYILDMFPYPSGEGLHVGHPRGYIGTDIYSRFKRMQGCNVLHPMGFDSFGLPAEQFAIKHKIHPEIAVKKNIKRYKEQLSILGFDYDWEREVVTSDPNYYKWTQWIFLQLFKKGLAYESYEPINWCPTCQTGLANEDLEDGKCERCGTPVEKKPMRQWVLKITDYADRMLEDLDELDWPESIKESQRNWIGRSEGAEIEFKLKGQEDVIKVFTTRVDTVDGVSFLVVALDHPLVKKYKLADIKAVNPYNGEEVPIFADEYVLNQYGTGAIMAVPAHDERDREFATKYNLPIIDRPLIDKTEVIKKVGGKKKINYKLRDWVFSRQRYWGEPIPIIHCLTCGVVSVPEKDLPIKLPKVKNYEPTGTGESPLANIEKWINTKCPKCGGPGRRETNTMPQWAGSSWYYLRYIDPKNKKTLVDKKKEKYWSPINLYVGGTEHATRHLIYARFWHKFLYDIGVVNYKEPFTKLKNQGLILASDGRKMSKRWGNVINPDDIVKTYGADTLRLYEMFMGPFEQSVNWSTESILGPRRFLEKVWRVGESLRSPLRPEGHLPLAGQEKCEISPCEGGVPEGRGGVLEKLLHKTIKKVTEDIESMSFNTAISAMMILMNEIEKSLQLTAESYKLFLKILAPFASHITEEIWRNLGEKKSIHLSVWPKYDPKLIIDETVKIAVQVNGKVRAEIEIPTDFAEDKIREIALADENVKKWAGGREIKKFIYVKNKLVNIVI